MLFVNKCCQQMLIEYFCAISYCIFSTHHNTTNFKMTFVIHKYDLKFSSANAAPFYLKDLSKAQQNDILKVKEWINKKDVNAEDKYGYTALHYASRNGHLEICKLLISHGANTNALTGSGKVSPLHRCVTMGHYDIFRLLVDSGASVNMKDGDGKTALHRAVEAGHSIIAEEILKINPSLAEETDRKGCTPKGYLNNSQALLDVFNKYKLDK